MTDSHPGISTSNPDADRDNQHEDEASGGGPMTAEQTEELSRLALLAEEPDAFDEHLTSLEAQNRIALLRRKAGA